MGTHVNVNPNASNFPFIFRPRLKELSKFVKGNGNDEITAVQAAFDWCETNKYTLYIDIPVTIMGTLYYGNVNLLHSGRNDAIITVLSDSNWNQLGAANRRTEAGIITKASSAAALGYTSVESLWEGVLVDFTNTADAEAIKSCMVPEYWQGGGYEDCRIRSVSCTATAETTTLDLYKGCQNLKLNLISDNRGATSNLGGTWIRSLDKNVPTKDITSSKFHCYNSTLDEALAIFNSVALVGAGNGGFQNINLHGVKAYHDSSVGACAGGIWVRNATEAGQEESHVNLYGPEVEVELMKNGGAGLRYQAMSGIVDSPHVKINGIDTGVTTAYGYRADTYDGTRATPQLNNPRLIADGVVAKGLHDGSSGAAALSDSTASWTTNAFIGHTAKNISDGSEGSVTANTATTVTATLAGGSENDWDATDRYVICKAFEADVLLGYVGSWKLNDGHSDSINLGNIRTILSSQTGRVTGGEFKGTDNISADQTTEIVGAILHAPATDSYDMQEVTFEIDTDTFTSATVIDCDGNAVDYTRWHDIVVNLSGTGALSKPFFINVDTELDIDGFTVIGDATTMASIVKDNIIGGSVTRFRKIRNIVYDNGTTKDELYEDSRYIKTNNPNLTPGTQNVINIDTAARSITLTDFANHQGRFMLYNNKASGANSFVLTLSAGTYDGTNTVATSTAAGDYLIVDVPPDGNGTVVKNSGFTLS